MSEQPELDLDGGYVVSFRRVYDDPDFADWAEAAVFVWLYHAAVWKDGTYRAFNRNHRLKRGQLVTSISTICTMTGWSRGRAHRYLKRLEQAGKIEISRTVSGTAPTIVTLCKYGQYQAPKGAGGTVRGTVRNASGIATEQYVERNPNPQATVNKQKNDDPAAHAEQYVEQPRTARGTPKKEEEILHFSKEKWREDPDKEFYRFGKVVVGARNGALLTKVKRYYDGDLDRARDLLLQAQSRDDPVAYIAGAVTERKVKAGSTDRFTPGAG